MRRILFTWRGMTIWSYPALLYIGLIAGVVVGNIASHAVGVDAWRVFVAMHILIALALAGARSLHVVSRWPLYWRHRRMVWNRRDGGAAQYGGLIVAVPASVPILAMLELPPGTFWDIATFTILVGMVVTRIGCLLNGCCAGRIGTKWYCVHLPNHLGKWERRVPTQLLEAAWAAVLLVLAIALWPSMPFRGALFTFAAAGYAMGRLFLESLREQDRADSELNVHHAISMGIVGVAALVFLANWVDPSR
jgi:prolipoprotein diacylglyceryltransferase